MSSLRRFLHRSATANLFRAPTKVYSVAEDSHTHAHDMFTKPWAAFVTWISTIRGKRRDTSPSTPHPPPPLLPDVPLLDILGYLPLSDLVFPTGEVSSRWTSLRQVALRRRKRVTLIIYNGQNVEFSHTPRDIIANSIWADPGMKKCFEDRESHSLRLYSAT